MEGVFPVATQTWVCVLLLPSTVSPWASQLTASYPICKMGHHSFTMEGLRMKQWEVTDTKGPGRVECMAHGEYSVSASCLPFFSPSKAKAGSST